MELINTIADDLNIVSYKNENPIFYIYRVIYCFTVSWINSTIGSSVSKNMHIEEIRGNDIRHIKYIVARKLDCILDIYPECRCYFGKDECSYDIVSKIFAKMECCNLLLKIDSRHYCAYNIKKYKLFNSYLIKGGNEITAKNEYNLYYVGLGKWLFEKQKDSEDTDMMYSHRNISSKEWFKNIEDNLIWNSYDYDNNNVEVYYPEIKTNSHLHRWKLINAVKIKDNNLYLIKIDKYQYSLIKKLDDTLLHYPLNSWYSKSKEINRILFYFDDFYKNSTQSTYIKNEDYIELIVYNSLPLYEYTLLNICGWQKSLDKANSDYYKYVIDIKLWNVVKKSLINLGIVLKGE